MEGERVGGGGAETAQAVEVRTKPAPAISEEAAG